MQVTPASQADSVCLVSRTRELLSHCIIIVIWFKVLNTCYVIHCDSEESQVWESHESLQEGTTPSDP